MSAKLGHEQSDEIRPEAKILDPIYYTTDTYVSGGPNKATPDVLSEGKKKMKGNLTIDTTKNVETFSDQLDVKNLMSEKDRNEQNDGSRGSEISEDDLESAPSTGLIFTTNKQKYQEYISEYKLNSIVYLLQPTPPIPEPSDNATAVAGSDASKTKVTRGCPYKGDRKELRTYFAPIRHKAVSFLKKRLLDLLTVYQLKNTYDMDANEMLAKVPHNLFSWSFKDFLKRRRLKGTAYIDNFVQEVLPYDANTLKLIHDIKETKRIINKLFESEELGKRSKQELVKFMTPELSSIQSLLNIEDKLIAVIEAYISADENNKCVLEYFKNLKDDAKDEEKMALEMKLIDIQLWNPIELRYILNWIGSKQNQCEMNAKVQEDNLTKQIQKEVYEKELFQMTSRSTIDATHTLIEVLKVKISDMSNKYQVDFDAIDNKNVYLQKRIDFFENEMKHLTVEIQRFHVEIEAMQQKLDEEERIRLEKEALKAQSSKKGKKGKGKKGKDGKGGKKSKKK